MAIQRFEDLVAWQRAIALATKIDNLLEKTALGRHRCLADQMSRSSISISSNIAEGFEKYSRKEFGRYLGTAKGSCGELRSQLHVAKLVGRIESATADALIRESEEVSRIIGGLRASLERRKDD